MIVATSYPLLDAFLTMLWIFLFIIWIPLAVHHGVQLTSSLASPDLSGWGKGPVGVGIIILPWLGADLPHRSRGKMHERQIQAAQLKNKPSVSTSRKLPQR